MHPFFRGLDTLFLLPIATTLDQSPLYQDHTTVLERHTREKSLTYHLYNLKVEIALPSCSWNDFYGRYSVWDLGGLVGGFSLERGAIESRDKHRRFAIVPGGLMADSGGAYDYLPQ